MLGNILFNGNIPVLMYHHISPSGGAHSVHPDTFRCQVSWLLEEGYTFLSALEFEALHLSGSKKVNKKLVVLTFDDGWLDNWIYALPVLQEFNVPSIFFIISSWPGDGEPRYELKGALVKLPLHEELMQISNSPVERDSAVMRWSELVYCRDNANVSIQSHSHSHGDWWRQAINQNDLIKRFEQDSQDSIAIFKNKLGVTPSQYCWPRGQFNKDIRAFISDFGYRLQYSTMKGVNISRMKPSSRSLIVRRLNVENRSLSWFKFQLKLYSIPGVGRLIGCVFQYLQGRRMCQYYGKRFGRNSLRMMPWDSI